MEENPAGVDVECVLRLERKKARDFRPVLFDIRCSLG
jgi:hypothetical protein